MFAHPWARRIAAVAIPLALAGAPPARAQEPQDEVRRQLEELKRRDAERQKELEALRKRDAAREQALEELKQQLQKVQATSEDARKDKAAAELDRAVDDLLRQQEKKAKSDIAAVQAGGARLRLIDISLDALTAAGWSTLRDGPLQRVQGGNHDPRKRGFTIQNVELSLTGAVDPFLNGEVHLIYFLDPLSGESEFELEEAFFVTQQLPWRLQLKGGQFFTEFGIVNPQHPHQWDWQDQPVIHTRIFGQDGMRGPGARLSWLAPLPWYSELLAGVQNANGETMHSFLSSEEAFEERGIGGYAFTDRDARSARDLVYHGRWANSVDLSSTWTATGGLSGAWGPNPTGKRTTTTVYGADLQLRWKPASHRRGFPYFKWQTELLGRRYETDTFFTEREVELEGETVTLRDKTAKRVLRDHGFYTQALFGFREGWSGGLRYEFATGSGKSVVDGGRERDPFRDDRHRISPLLIWQPTEFSRVRLQYNFDFADHLEAEANEGKRHAHSVWLSIEFLFGKHPAHKY